MSRHKHAARVNPAPSAAKPAKEPETLRPVVDFPRQYEKIAHPQYTFRVGAAASAKRVEVSINQGPWKACRPASGYWWYDWTGYTAGEHEVVARAYAADGRGETSEPKEFFVELP